MSTSNKTSEEWETMVAQFVTDFAKNYDTWSNEIHDDSITIWDIRNFASTYASLPRSNRKYFQNIEERKELTKNIHTLEAVINKHQEVLDMFNGPVIELALNADYNRAKRSIDIKEFISTEFQRQSAEPDHTADEDITPPVVAVSIRQNRSESTVESDDDKEEDESRSVSSSSSETTNGRIFVLGPSMKALQPFLTSVSPDESKDSVTGAAWPDPDDENVDEIIRKLSSTRIDRKTKIQLAQDALDSIVQGGDPDDLSPTSHAKLEKVLAIVETVN